MYQRLVRHESVFLFEEKMFSSYVDIYVFDESTNFKICDIIEGINCPLEVTFGCFFSISK